MPTKNNHVCTLRPAYYSDHLLWKEEDGTKIWCTCQISDCDLLDKITQLGMAIRWYKTHLPIFPTENARERWFYRINHIRYKLEFIRLEAERRGLVYARAQ